MRFRGISADRIIEATERNGKHWGLHLSLRKAEAGIPRVKRAKAESLKPA